MFKINFTQHKSIDIFSFLVILNAILVSLTIPVRAEQNQSNNNNSDFGFPTHRRDGGSRGFERESCIANTNNQNLIALVPEKAVGVNASASPKLFFYIPKVNKQKTLEFVLRNQQDELIYEAFLTTEGEGVIGVDIPSQVQTDLVENDGNYHWYLSMICNPYQRSRDVVVEGWMRQSQIDTVARQELAKIDSVEQAEMYHQKGFWYDALSVLANNYQSGSEQPLIEAKWSELLTSVGLSEIASAPFVDSKIIKSSVRR